ncbi:MAG TPA: LacI family DNA-binding transcriptional regulator [Caldilineaceae bacterium]|nr:LacI family DNA-binding transcriptional regulator [Caldilineaceae bacterium]
MGKRRAEPITRYNGNPSDGARSEQVRTIGDLARLAGVSASTVSRALNDSPLVREETRERIQALARQHDFQLHAGAQSLRLQRSQTLAMVVDKGPGEDRIMSDPFLLELLGEIATNAARYRYDVLISQAQDQAQDWRRYFIAGGRADGLIILAHMSSRAQRAQRLLASGAPFVVWGPAVPGQPYCSVGSDDYQGGYSAVEHLIRLGRQRIAMLGFDSDCLELKLRFDGYRDALQAAGREVESRFVAHSHSSSQGGYEAMRRLLVRAPDLDAVFVGSDVMAIGALEGLRSAGRTVPDDVAVVGYDDIALAAYCSPPLTTVRQNLPLAGRLLVERLLDVMEGRPAAPVMLPTELIVRRSCGALPGP